MSLILYHKQAGSCPVAIIQMNMDAYAYSVSYKDAFPEHLLRKEPVFLVGVVFSKPQIEKLLSIATRVIYFDHRPDNIQVMKNMNLPNLEMVCDTEHSTAELCWQYFFPDQPVSKAVMLFGKYSRWKLDDEVLSFHYGTSVLNTDNPDTWRDLIVDKDGIVEKAIGRGHLFREYFTVLEYDVANDLIYRTMLNNIPMLAANIRMNNSLFFNCVDKKDAKFGLQYQYNPKLKEYHVTISKLDNESDYSAREIAQQFGGGGGPDIAAFTCKPNKLPFLQEGDITKQPSRTIHYENVLAFIKKEPTILAPLAEDQEKRSGWSQYLCDINGYKAVCCNMPTTDWSIYPSNLGVSDIAVSWVWESSGRYRVIVKSLQPTANLGYFRDNFDCYVKDGVYVFHTDKLPFCI